MAELSPAFGLVQKGQEKVRQEEGNCEQDLEIPHCSSLLSLGPTGFLSPHSVDSV